LKGKYQYVLAVHTDHEHIHCHIIFNNTNISTNRSFETEENQGKKSERAWAKLRAVSDETCREHGLSVIEEPQKNTGISHFERDMRKEGKSWKDKLRTRIAEIAYYSKNLEDFFRNCTDSGIEYVYKRNNKYKLKFRMEGQERFTRAETLGEEYTAERTLRSRLNKSKNCIQKYIVSLKFPKLIRLKRKKISGRIFVVCEMLML